MLTMLAHMAMTIVAADDSSSMLQQEVRSRTVDIKSDIKSNASAPNDCLTRTNFLRTKWGLELMAEEPSCFACVSDASCSNKEHGAHSSRNYGITCPLRAQSEGGGNTCGNVVDAWYNERYSCSTSAGNGAPYKVAPNVKGKRACMSACNSDAKCKSFDYTDVAGATDPCRFFDVGQTEEAPETCSAFDVGYDYKNGRQLGMVPNIESAADCCEQCRLKEGCNFYSWFGSVSLKNQCWLKTNNAGRRKIPSLLAVSGGPRFLAADPNARQYCSGGDSGHGDDGNGACTGHCGAVMRGPQHAGGLVMSCANCGTRWTCNYGLEGKFCDTSCSTGKWNQGKCVGGSVNGPSPPAPSPKPPSVDLSPPAPSPSPKPDCSALKTALNQAQTAFKKDKRAKTAKTAFKNAKKAWKKCMNR